MSAKTEFKELVEIAREFLEAVSKEMDSHSKVKGIIKEEGSKVILLTPSHIQYAKYGRGPGKKPPFQDIFEWVKSEGIKFQDATPEGTAWAIQTSIGKHGTKNWVPNAPSFLEESINKHFEEYNVLMGNKLAVIINDEVNKIYKQIDLTNIM